tara:strand:+ start:333 stop:710 length:378 start_codon:yes stop_codon:yes gene_type:complete
MSTLKVTTIQDTSGGNASTSEQIAQGRAKAWVNFNSVSSISIRDSFNVSSVTESATGDYQINFSSNMSNANYCITTAGNYRDNDAAGRVFVVPRTQSTSTFQLEIYGDGGGQLNSERVFAAVHGD